jgi:hypothetical protein
VEPSASSPASDTEPANQSRLDERIAVNDQMLQHLRAARTSLLKASNLFDDERDNAASDSNRDQNGLDGLVAKRLERNLDESLRSMNVVVGDLEDRAAHLTKQREARAGTDDYRELLSNEFPEHGHMLVVSGDWNAVYWLADRHALIRAGASVELEGPGQRLLEAPTDDRGLITFRYVREHDVARITEGTLPARAAGTLTDPDRIEQTLYPPAHVPEVSGRFVRPYLQPPAGLTVGDAMVLDRQRGKVYWLRIDDEELEDSEVFEAQVDEYGPVHWGTARVTAHHPKWVFSALIDHARTR